MAKRKDLVASARNGAKKHGPEGKKPVTVVDGPSTKANEFSPLQYLIGKKLGEGHKIPDLARKYHRQLVPHEKDSKLRLKKARARIRHWYQSQKFRDLVWDQALLQIDAASPDIIAGLIHKGAAGRVDAARFAFELNGRHAPNTEEKPAEIHINFGGVARPPRHLPEADVTVADEEIEEVEPD